MSLGVLLFVDKGFLEPPSSLVRPASGVTLHLTMSLRHRVRLATLPSVRGSEAEVRRRVNSALALLRAHGDPGRKQMSIDASDMAQHVVRSALQRGVRGYNVLHVERELSMPRSCSANARDARAEI